VLQSSPCRLERLSVLCRGLKRQTINCKVHYILFKNVVAVAIFIVISHASVSSQDVGRAIGVILEVTGIQAPRFGVGDGPPLYESLKSEILPSKRVMQKCRVQTVM